MTAHATPSLLPAGYSIREFTMADYDRAVALWRSCEGIGLNESDTPDAIGRFLQRNPGLSVVVEDRAGMLVAAMLCGHDGRRGYLHHLAVAPDHRRRRIAQTVVELSLARLAELAVPKCNLFLYAHNEAGRAFWERHDWKPRVDLVVLQKPTG